MKIILTENQYHKILLQESKKELGGVISDLKSFANTVITKTQEDVGVNLKMLLIWGAGVGGVIEPLNNFIASGNFELNEFQVSLILCSTAAILFGESKRTIKILLGKIEEEGIEDEFDEVYRKGVKLKQAFISFIESLNMTLYTVTNIMSYAFVIPLLPILHRMSNSGINDSDVKEMILRLVSFGLASISGNLMKELITKLIKRFKD
jgi:hypothetical protein